MPRTDLLRFDGSGLCSSRPGASLVQAITPQSAFPHGTVRICAVPSSTSHSPTGDCAYAAPIEHKLSIPAAIELFIVTLSAVLLASVMLSQCGDCAVMRAVARDPAL